MELLELIQLISAKASKASLLWHVYVCVALDTFVSLIFNPDRGLIVAQII
mgnify:FL=1